MKDFNLVQYLRENNQGSFGMLNHYVDLKPLKEENQEVPYQGPEDKLDGFGDSFDQVEAIPELEKPENIYNNNWMNSSVDNKKIGNWTCYYDDQMKALYWIHDQILSEDIVVYATPNFDGAKGIAVEVHVDYGGLLVDNDTIGSSSYPDFNSYAKDVAPFLKMVENKYFKGDYDQYKNDEVLPEVDADDSMTNDRGWQYDDDNNSFDVNLVYTDYPSMSDAQQRLSTIQFLKLVKSLGGVATKTNDDFDTITFSVTGIPSLEVLEDKYSQVVNNEDDNYVALGSWDLQPVDSETTSLSEMYTDMKEEGEGFQSQHADSEDWERFYQEGWNAGYDEGYRDAKKEFNTTGNNDYYKFFR
jgi:hypothetical protein